MLVEKNKQLAKFSGLAAGGLADSFVECKSIEELIEILNEIRGKENFIVLGGGSNTVFSDRGLRGYVLKISFGACHIEGDQIEAQAGLALNALIMKSLQSDLVGLENLFGIPGTLGGAVRGNAGAYGSEISDNLVSVNFIDPQDETLEVVEKEKSQLFFAYRNSFFKEEEKAGRKKIICSARFKLKKSPEEATILRKDIFRIQKERTAKYPLEPNCGSFFMNPHENFAGRLIEEAGLKGTQIGGIAVSKKHGNFLINLGGGTCAELLELKKLIQVQIAQKSKINLIPEVQIYDDQGKLLS
jgi:UDP-N-acetylmuramate dehydrogenase